MGTVESIPLELVLCVLVLGDSFSGLTIELDEQQIRIKRSREAGDGEAGKTFDAR